MNHLALIQKKLKREQQVQSYIKRTAYRGSRYELVERKVNSPHGDFCYRGNSYSK